MLDGFVGHNKTQLVSRGFTREYGVDYDDTSSEYGVDYDDTSAPIARTSIMYMPLVVADVMLL